MVLNVVPFVHKILKETITVNDYTIDATCGNGYDTLELAKISKFVYGFDIQDLAIENTKKILEDHNHKNYRLIKDSHENMVKYIDQKVKAITFNLGYLPGSDKTVKTNPLTTINGIEASCNLLTNKGIICIILYIGHEGGLSEALEVETYVSSLDKRMYKVIKYDFINQVQSPYVIIIEKQ